MIHEKLLNSLQHIDLDENKAKAYIAALELGTAKANTIAEKARIKRTAIYDILDKLKNRGLMSSYTKRGINYFTASDPSRIYDILLQQKKEIETAIPQLKDLVNSAASAKPNIRFFEGVEGAKLIFEEILDAKEKFYRTIQSPGRINDKLNDENFFVTWSKRRMQKGINHHSLRDHELFVIRKEKDPIVMGQGNAYLRTIRYLPENLHIPFVTSMWDNKVMVMPTSDREHFSFIVESHDFAQGMKNIFETLWSISKTEAELLQP